MAAHWSSKLRRHANDVDPTGLQNTRATGSKGVLTRFQRKDLEAKPCVSGSELLLHAGLHSAMSEPEVKAAALETSGS